MFEYSKELYEVCIFAHFLWSVLVFIAVGSSLIIWLRQTLPNAIIWCPHLSPVWVVTRTSVVDLLFLFCFDLDSNWRLSSPFFVLLTFLLIKVCWFDLSSFRSGAVGSRHAGDLQWQVMYILFCISFIFVFYLKWKTKIKGIIMLYLFPKNIVLSLYLSVIYFVVGFDLSGFLYFISSIKFICFVIYFKSKLC